jgi:hypothetical protein
LPGASPQYAVVCRGIVLGRWKLEKTVTCEAEMVLRQTRGVRVDGPSERDET